ncbi:MAG: hypothetical protein WCF26_10950 [Candidatus Sulfotelmatobacter sp.]
MSSALILAGTAHQAPKERIVWELGVGTAHGIAAQQKTVCFRGAKEAVEEKPIFSKGEHDFTGAYVISGAPCDFDNIVRPKSGQHALPSDLQTQTAAQAQIVRG